MVHRECQVDDWLLYSSDSPNASGARGFARGEIFKRDGTLVASVAQEGLIRKIGTNKKKVSSSDPRLRIS